MRGGRRLKSFARLSASMHGGRYFEMELNQDKCSREKTRRMEVSQVWGHVRLRWNRRFGGRNCSMAILLLSFLFLFLFLSLCFISFFISLIRGNYPFAGFCLETMKSGIRGRDWRSDTRNPSQTGLCVLPCIWIVVLILILIFI
jgi:hypothetical protein